ncbi:1733_t:CDS:2, partial [Scutellospora calospora]
TSQYHCDTCDFDACPSHCKSGEKCEPKSHCRKRHPLRYSQSPAMWMCDECRKLCYGRRLKCNQCDYEMCPTCLSNEDLAYLKIRSFIPTDNCFENLREWLHLPDDDISFVTEEDMDEIFL